MTLITGAPLTKSPGYLLIGMPTNFTCMGIPITHLGNLLIRILIILCKCAANLTCKYLKTKKNFPKRIVAVFSLILTALRTKSNKKVEKFENLHETNHSGGRQQISTILVPSIFRFSPADNLRLFHFL
jgi:hypothetical protein